MVSAFSQFIEERSLCNPNHKILVGVSGGIDSIVMLDLFDKAGYDISIAHFNFKLRGQESDQDELFVRKLDKKYKVKVFTKSFDTEPYAKDNKLSIQEAARNLRYNWFEKLAIDKGFDRIAIGQHLDDQIETFFINLFRGSGVKGLKGMPVKRGKIIRPLMFANRKQIKDYADTHKLKYREDSSNTSEKYLRNSIRHNLLPILTEIKSSSDDSILKSIGHLTEDYQDFQKLLNDLRVRIIQKDKVSRTSINEVKIMNASLFYQLLSIFNFNREVTDAILLSIQNKATGKIFYSSSHKLLIDRYYLFVEEKERPGSENEYLIDDNVKVIHEPIHLNFTKFQNDKSMHINKSSEYAYFDFDKLVFPLKLRKWRKGDRFIPFGMRGNKLVSDYLIDAKVSRFDKEKVWVLLSDENIIWIVGYRTSEIYRLKHNTKTCLKIIYKLNA